MKRKIFIALTLSLSALALVSCEKKKDEPTFKKFGTEITKTEFAFEWQRLFDFDYSANVDKILHMTECESFSYNARMSIKSYEKTSTVVKYDKDNKISTRDLEITNEYESGHQKYNGTNGLNIQYQQNESDWIGYEKNSKLYKRVSYSSTGFGLLNEYFVNVNVDDTTKYYKNGDVISAIYTSQDKSETSFGEVLQKVQFYVRDNELNYIAYRTDASQSVEDATESLQSYTLKYSDKSWVKINIKFAPVTIKSLDTTKYQVGNWDHSVM